MLTMYLQLNVYQGWIVQGLPLSPLLGNEPLSYLRFPRPHFENHCVDPSRA